MEPALATHAAFVVLGLPQRGFDFLALPKLSDAFQDWKQREALAETMIPIIGKLYRKNIVTYCYGRSMNHQGVTDLMKTHRRVRQIDRNELSEFETHPILEILAGMDLGPSHIDVGKLAVQYMRVEAEAGPDNKPELRVFVEAAVAEVIGRHVPPLTKPQHIVLYGFGRIGRLLARLIIEKTGSGSQLVLKAVVLRDEGREYLVKRAGLLRRDSVHGAFKGTIRVDEKNECIIANGNVIRVIYANDRSQIDYRSYGIEDAIIIDSTGAWRDEAGLAAHLQSDGAERVLLTAPAKAPVQNIVSGVNSHLVKSESRVLGAASCTTNAIVPLLKVMNDQFKIVHGHIETVHAYTPDQNLADNFHRKTRRGRAAPLNLVITETGASSAVVQLLPELDGKLTGNAIRVPTPNVSLAILHLTLTQETSTEAVNEYLRHTALHSSLQRQIDYTISPEVVSSDFVGNRHACIVDASATQVDHNRVVVYAWYDNEFGYSCQVVRMAQKWAGIRYPLIPGDVADTGFENWDAL